ncbi:MAG: tRNA dihydrouridine synthase DusB [Planctomycetota bacterium]|nr:MAG: tRNA dihydrouridine synthase DusB [Planctomycetota bacterium]
MLGIGKVRLATNLLLSPMSGYCDLAFRLTIRPLGGLGLACTDLVNPRGLLEQTRKSMRIVETEAGDRPLCIQLYGHEPNKMADAALWCQEHKNVGLLDINMGCPAQKVCRRGGGAALLNNIPLAIRIAERVVEAVDIPVTVKMRLGWDDNEIVASELARQLEEVGVAGIMVHGRTAEQKLSGTVRLDEIGRVVEAVSSIPVIGNGDICLPMDAKKMIEHTGCAGVMIGRGALRDPWIFRDTQAFLTTGKAPTLPTNTERVELMNQHFEHLIRIQGERLGCLTMRQRARWLLKKIDHPPEFRERVRFVSSAAEYYELVDEYLR